MPRNVAATTNVPRRLSVRTDDTLKRISNIQSFSVVDLVFPNFNLFEEDNLDYFSEYVNKNRIFVLYMVLFYLMNCLFWIIVKMKVIVSKVK